MITPTTTVINKEVRGAGVEQDPVVDDVVVDELEELIVLVELVLVMLEPVVLALEVPLLAIHRYCFCFL